jgi:penicillin-binding protein 2
MSFHPNDVIRRGRAASVIVCGVLVFLLSAFFRTQVVKNKQLLMQSEENRLRQIPLPAPRGLIYDRNGKLIADNAVGYSIAMLTENEDSLRANITRLRGTIAVTNRQLEQAIQRYRKDRGRPVVILPDASFDVISMLEEHRIDYPNLIIQSSPKRIYPAGKAVGAFVGYIAEINEDELAKFGAEGYKAGQQIGKRGLEQQYEKELRGREGAQFVEVDSRGRIVNRSGARPDDPPVAAPPLKTNIDLDLQTFIEGLFGDTLSGGAVALDPKTGGVLAIYSSPGVDPNRWIGGIPASYFDSLNTDPRRPLYNKALQGAYPPGSTWKLATAVVGLEDSVVTFTDRMPQPCTGAFYFGNRSWKCWDKNGHGNPDLTAAIAQSCDVYFYQLGLKIGLSRLVAGGIKLGFKDRSGIDLPGETRPSFPNADVAAYFNQKEPRGWTAGAQVVNMSIGQGANAQTVLNMARFYAALATNGNSPTPRVAQAKAESQKVFNLTADQFDKLRAALVGVVSSGTAAASAIKGVQMAGKTGTAQSGHYRNGIELNHAWFAGFAPADDPKIVVAIMLEDVSFHGSVTAHMASAIIQRYLHVATTNTIVTEGN